jgi:hypothetical protein
MADPTTDNDLGKNGVPSLLSVADELQKLAKQLALEQRDPAKCKQLSERLQQLADQLQAQEEADAEMRENYPHFKEAAYALLQEHFERELAPLPEGKDLETIAAEEGALPLEAFYPGFMPEKEGPRDGG